MADVEVGQVRRERPRRRKGRLVYARQPFVVVDYSRGFAPEPRYRICSLPLLGLEVGPRPRWRPASRVAECPLWPSEHEQWKDAKGYEVAS